MKLFFLLLFLVCCLGGCAELATPIAQSIGWTVFGVDMTQ